MLISFVPVFSASAEEVASAKAETISYRIKRTSISTETFSGGTHYVPVETEEGENYGKLKFTATDGTVTYANPTVINVLTNLWSNFTSNTTGFSVSKVFLTSYRELDYYQYTSNLTASPVTWMPLRSFVKGYNTGDLKSLVVTSKWGIKGDDNNKPITYKMPATLDLSKTAPFEIMGAAHYTHAWLYDYGYDGTYVVGKNDTPTSLYDSYKNGVDEFNFALRIKIPEDAVAGKYTLCLGSDSNKTSGDDYYTDKNASTNDVFVIKVPETGIEGLYDYNANGGLYAFTDSTGAQIDKSVYVNDDTFIGQFRAEGGKSTSYDKIFDVAPGEEYIIYFRMAANSITIDEETGIATNVFYRPNASDRYQNFRISYANLVPVVEDDEEYTSSFDAVEENYTTGGTATVNAYTYTDKENSLSLNNTVALGGTYSADAPEIEGYHFLYWAKGASSKKQIVSYEESFSFKPHEGANYLVAVYEKDGDETAKAEFYNANGDLIATLTENGKAPHFRHLQAMATQAAGCSTVTAQRPSMLQIQT